MQQPHAHDGTGRGWTLDVLFFAVLALCFAIPVVGAGPLAQSAGGSGSASGEAGGSAGGSGSGGVEGGVEGEVGGGGSGGGSGSGSGSQEPEPAPGESSGAQPAPTAAAPPPPAGTTVRTRADRLPPYVPLACLGGKVPGVEVRGDPAAIERLCRQVRVAEVDDGFVLFGSIDTEVSLSEVDLTIEVPPTEPSVVVVTPSYGGTNRVLATLFAAGLLVVVAAGIALALRQRRPPPGEPPGEPS